MAGRKQDQGVRGALRKMFGGRTTEKKSLSSSSSPMERESESQPQSLNHSCTTHSEQDEKPGLLLNFLNGESDLSVGSNGSCDRYQLYPKASSPSVGALAERKVRELDPATETNRTCVLTLYYENYGTEEQIKKAAERLVENVELKGYLVISARLNNLWDIR